MRYSGNPVDQVNTNTIPDHQRHKLGTCDTACCIAGYPDEAFELHCQGEDGDQWLVNARNGAVTTRHGRVLFGPEPEPEAITLTGVVYHPN